MAYTNPSVSDFKSYFSRNFPYGTDSTSTVLDSDITNAEQLAAIMINPALWPDQQSYNVGFLLLSAHNMVLNLRASSQGINGQFDWLENSKSVGNVSQSFSIPQRILDNPELALYAQTPYGMQYLMLVLPQLTGQVYNAYGTTLP